MFTMIEKIRNVESIIYINSENNWKISMKNNNTIVLYEFDKQYDFLDSLRIYKKGRVTEKYHGKLETRIGYRNYPIVKTFSSWPVNNGEKKLKEHDRQKFEKIKQEIEKNQYGIKENGHLVKITNPNELEILISCFN